MPKDLCKVPVSHHSMKLSLKLMGLNVDGAAFYCFTCSAQSAEIVQRIILAIVLHKYHFCNDYTSSFLDDLPLDPFASSLVQLLSRL